MTRLIKNIRGRHLVEFDKGLFDDWCVYLTRYGAYRYAPKDTEYFTILQNLGAKHECQQIYNDFLKFYSLTTKEIDTKVLELITQISDNYGTDAEEIDIWFTVIYAGMIAEENKAFSKLGKRIKRLGMYQVLCEKTDPHVAANFSRKPKDYTGRWWKYLDSIMVPKGI